MDPVYRRGPRRHVEHGDTRDAFLSPTKLNGERAEYLWVLLRPHCFGFYNCVQGCTRENEEQPASRI
eukprot:1010701-Pyramimonas_sp.AAC.1